MVWLSVFLSSLILFLISRPEACKQAKESKKISQCHHMSSNLNCWYMIGLIHASRMFTADNEPSIWMSQQQSRHLRPGNMFPNLKSWWACMSCSPISFYSSSSSVQDLCFQKQVLIVIIIIFSFFWLNLAQLCNCTLCTLCAVWYSNMVNTT